MDRRSRSALDYLFGLEQFGIKFGLENISRLVEQLGHPERAFLALHIAGTNGKGSVTAMVDTALRAAGHRAARYTSPHLVDLNERFVVDGRPAADEEMTDAVEIVRDAIRQLRSTGALQAEPTFFEATTAVAFELFRRAKVEVAAIEVGLGGRLDATNVLTPTATAITSIGFDHERYLGATLREIAVEKAGIIKPGVPVVVGALPADAFEAIAGIARERSADVIVAGESRLAPFSDTPLALRGAHQRNNAAVAVALLETANGRGIVAGRDAVRAGLATVSWPGRLDLRRFGEGREALLDAAHNPDGAAALAAYLRETWPGERPPLVFAAMGDKDVRGMLRALLPAIGALIVTRASTPRSADPTALAAQAREIAPELPVVVEPSRTAALAAAWRRAPRIVVAGSIFLLGDVLKERDGT